MQVFRLAVSMLMVCLAASCHSGPETVEQCVNRFKKMAKTMPVSAGRVHGSYTFDLSEMDRDDLQHLTAAGIGNGERPILMAANRDSDASRKTFYGAPLTSRGLLRIAGRSVLFRIPSGLQRSADDAVEKGCGLIPGAKLQAVALTAG